MRKLDELVARMDMSYSLHTGVISIYRISLKINPLMTITLTVLMREGAASGLKNDNAHQKFHLLLC
jgi:hypothetical protein